LRALDLLQPIIAISDFEAPGTGGLGLCRRENAGASGIFDLDTLALKQEGDVTLHLVTPGRSDGGLLRRLPTATAILDTNMGI
jgi:hypothetical protein